MSLIFINHRQGRNISILLNNFTNGFYMSETFYILKNFPQYLIEELKKEFSNKINGTMTQVLKQYHLPVDHKIMEYFPKSWMIEYFVIPKNFATPPHLDRKRLCAINIPIEVDCQNSFFFCGKHLWLGNYKKLDVQYPYDASNGVGPMGYYEYNAEDYLTYNMENPVIFSTKIPHGGNNRAGSFDRIICTIGYRDLTYEQLLNDIPTEWF